MMMRRTADATYPEEDSLRRDYLRNQIISLSNTNGAEPELPNILHALPGSKVGSCADLLTATKPRSLTKALQPKSPKDEQRSFSFSYRAPMLALPPKSSLTTAQRPVESSELYENQRQAKQRSRFNSFGGFSSQIISSTPSWKADSGFDSANNHTRASRCETSDTTSDRSVASHRVTLQRPNSPCRTRAPLPGGAQAHAQMLWVEKPRRESEPSSKFTGRESGWNNKEKETYKTYTDSEQGRNNTEKEPYWNDQEKEPRWNDTRKKSNSNHTESERHYISGMESRLSNTEKEPNWNNKENEPRFNYFNYSGNELCRNSTEKDPYWSNREKELFSSHAEKQPSWNRTESDLRSNNTGREPRCNNPAKKSGRNNTEQESNYKNREDSVFRSEPPWNITEKEPHRHGRGKMQRWSNAENEPYVNNCRNDPHWNNPEIESSWNIADKESRWANSEEENQKVRPSDSAILPSRYSLTSASARSHNNQHSSEAELTTLSPQRKPLTQPATSTGDELRLETSPLNKLSSFRYGCGREPQRKISQNDLLYSDDLVSGNDLSKATPVVGKATDSQMSGLTSRDRALGQSAAPQLMNKQLSRSAVNLSRICDQPRGSGERTLPRTSEGHFTSGKYHNANQFPSNTQLGSDRSRTMDRKENPSNQQIRGRPGQIATAQTIRNRWASLDREQQGPREFNKCRIDLILARKDIFDPCNSAGKNTFQTRGDSRTPSNHASLTDAAGRHNEELTYPNYKARTRSDGNIIPSQAYVYGSNMNLARFENYQDPGYKAMTSSQYPSARSNDHDGNVTGAETRQSETAMLSPRLNHGQPSGTSDPRCNFSFQLNLTPQQSNFYSATSENQSEDVTKNSIVSSHSQMKARTEPYLLQSIAGPDSTSAEFIGTYTQGGYSELSRPLGTTMAATGYHQRKHSTQMSDGNLTEDSGLGFSDNSVLDLRSLSSSTRDDSRFNQDTRSGTGSVRGAPAEPTTALSGSTTMARTDSRVGQTRVAVSPGYSEKGYVQMEDETEGRTTKKMFTKEDWIRTTKMAGKSHKPVEDNRFNVRSAPSDGKRLSVEGTETNTLRSAPAVDWRKSVDSRQINTYGTDRSAPPVDRRLSVDSREPSTRKDERAMSNSVKPLLTSVKQDSRSAPQKSTSAKWKEFLSGSVETESAGKVQGHQFDEWRRERPIPVGESVRQCSEDQLTASTQWPRKEERTLQLPLQQKDTSITTTTVEEPVFDSDEDILERAGDRTDFIASATPLENVSTSQGTSVTERSSMEQERMFGYGKTNGTSQGTEWNERKMENCSDEACGLREVEIYVNMGALGVGFCVEGGLQSVSGDKPITIKRIFTGACGHLRGKLKPGDQILRVNDTDFRQMSHYNAWNFLKTLPEGPAKLLIYAK